MKASDLVAGEVWISVLALESTSRALDVYPNQSRSRARLTSLATCGTADWGVDFVDCGADTVWPEERLARRALEVVMVAWHAILSNRYRLLVIYGTSVVCQDECDRRR